MVVTAQVATGQSTDPETLHALVLAQQNEKLEAAKQLARDNYARQQQGLAAQPPPASPAAAFRPRRRGRARPVR